MTIIPPRYGDRVTTDAMADTEAASSIPPWPIDFVPTPSAVEPDLIDGAGAVVVPVLVLAVVILWRLLRHWSDHSPPAMARPAQCVDTGRQAAPIREDEMREFLTIYKLYRRHGRLYALRAAWRIAVHGMPF